MKRKYTRWTREILSEVVKVSRSYSECLRNMGLVNAGGNYSHLQRNIHKYNIDCSHMLHQAWNSGNETKMFHELTRPSSIKRRLIIEYGHKCFDCGLTTWQGREIPLELEHIDGDNRNNSKDNLKLLCCNCHALTPTWRNRKRL